MSTKVLIIAADGSEDMETVIIYDILMRANFDVVLSSVNSSNVIETKYGLKINVHVSVEEIKNDLFDAVVIPGGLTGRDNILKNSTAKEIILKHHQNNKVLGAVCAGPSVFSELGILENKKATIYPSLKDKIKLYTGQPVTKDGNIITGQAPGTTIAFILTIVKALKGSDITNDLIDSMLISPDVKNLI